MTSFSTIRSSSLPFLQCSWIHFSAAVSILCQGEGGRNVHLCFRWEDGSFSPLSLHLSSFIHAHKNTLDLDGKGACYWLFVLSSKGSFAFFQGKHREKYNIFPLHFKLQFADRCGKTAEERLPQLSTTDLLWNTLIFVQILRKILRSYQKHAICSHWIDCTACFLDLYS